MPRMICPICQSDMPAFCPCYVEELIRLSHEHLEWKVDFNQLVANKDWGGAILKLRNPLRG